MPGKSDPANSGGTVTLDAERYMRRLRIIGAAGTSVLNVEKALDAAREGKIRAMVNCTVPLSEAAEAHRIVEQSQIAGKIILEPMQD